MHERHFHMLKGLVESDFPSLVGRGQKYPRTGIDLRIAYSRVWYFSADFQEVMGVIMQEPPANTRIRNLILHAKDRALDAWLWLRDALEHSGSNASKPSDALLLKTYILLVQLAHDAPLDVKVKEIRPPSGVLTMD